VDPFRNGCDVAAITHGHPSGFLSAGFLAMLIAELFDGATLEEALDRTEPYLQRWPECEEVGIAVRQARRMAESSEPTPENIERLGEGWVAEEALAIAIFCAVTAGNCRSGVLAAANHGGDSDSTGAITGNILGTLWGVGAIPQEWVEEVEGRKIAEILGRDLIEIASGEGEVSDYDRRRYPGW
jgi:ADP-ribosylglycohydrolase